MGEQAKVNVEPAEHDARKPASKVGAWIEEARFKRSLVGPGAHRAAYRRLVGEVDGAEMPRPRAPNVRAPLATEPSHEDVPPYHTEKLEPAPGMAPRARRMPPRRIAPRHRRPARHQQRARTTLYAVSAIAALFLSAPFGYWAYDSVVDDAFAPAARQQSMTQSDAPAVQATLPAPADAAAAKAAVAPVQAASEESGRESLTVTEVAKEESDTPYRSLTETASLRSNEQAPLPEASPEALATPAPAQQVQKMLDRIPTDDQRSTGQQASEAPAPEKPAVRLPEADPRAAELLDQGEQLVQQGEIANARRFFERAAELGEPKALVQLARTYDPVVLKELKVVGLKPEPEKAVELYERARAAMSGETDKRPGPSAWLTR